MMNALLVAVALAVIVVLAKRVAKKEPFGSTSPGTMTQLATSHVPTQEDYIFYKDVYPRMVRRDLIDMTGGDPGELRPWVFPWYNRSVAVIRQ
jgi:hypothetical protein